MKQYLIEHIGVWFGLGMTLLIAGFLVEVQYVEGLTLDIPVLTLAIVGMVFGMMVSRFSSIDLQLKKLKEQKV